MFVFLLRFFLKGLSHDYGHIFKYLLTLYTTHVVKILYCHFDQNFESVKGFLLLTL